MTDVA